MDLSLVTMTWHHAHQLKRTNVQRAGVEPELSDSRLRSTEAENCFARIFLYMLIKITLFSSLFWNLVVTTSLFSCDNGSVWNEQSEWTKSSLNKLANCKKKNCISKLKWELYFICLQAEIIARVYLLKRGRFVSPETTAVVEVDYSCKMNSEHQEHASFLCKINDRLLLATQAVDVCCVVILSPRASRRTMKHAQNAKDLYFQNATDSSY